MIVAYLSDPQLHEAVLGAAAAGEEVVDDPREAGDALERGFPRVIVCEPGWVPRIAESSVPMLVLDPFEVRRWQIERWRIDPSRSRTEHAILRIREEMERAGERPGWVDRVLADLSRAAGAQLPRPLRTFARRVLEFPARYTDLQDLSAVCGLSAGALKARFRRRGLDSPYAYLRWFRIVAGAEVLSDRTVTVARAAQRLGFTSDGNMCRAIAAVTAMTPTELRTKLGWSRIMVAFTRLYLTPDALNGWARLEELFDRRVA